MNFVIHLGIQAVAADEGQLHHGARAPVVPGGMGALGVIGVILSNTVLLRHYAADQG
jgi:hypothetical protein